MLLLTSLLALLVPTRVGPAMADPPINACDSLIIDQTRGALDALRAAAKVHADVDGLGQVAVYEGTVSFESHLMKPGMVRVLPYRIEIAIDASARVVSIRETLNPSDHPSVETTLFDGVRVALQTREDQPFKELAGLETSSSRADGALWFPTSTIRAALEAAASCRPGVPVDSAGQVLSPVTFTDPSGRACSVLLDEKRQVARVERLCAHERLGDACEWTTFDEWTRQEGASVPGHIGRFTVQSSTTTRYDVSLVSFHAGKLDPEARSLPEAHLGDIPTWGQQQPSDMAWASLAPGLWSLEVAASDSRVLLAEREKDLIVIGAPDGDAACSAIVREVGAKFPNKPIGIATFGHHHPASSGGIRAFAAAGASIMAPRELEPFVREMLARPTSLGAPAIAGPAAPKLELFDGDATISAGDHEIRLVNIAAKSTHAFQYVVFYIPDEGILAEDDLGYFALQGATRAGPRIIGLADALNERGIVPKRLIQLWPVKGVQKEVEWAGLEKLVNDERDQTKGRK